MNSNNRLSHSLTVILLLFFVGCSPERRPKDLPKLYPCVLQVMQEGNPLPDAVVKLLPQAEEKAKYQSIATTGADGTAALSTYGFPGVPEGKYKAVVIKNMEDDIVYRTDEAGEKVLVSSNRYRMVEEKFSDEKTTPFEIDITPKDQATPFLLDAGKAIHVKMNEK